MCKMLGFKPNIFLYYVWVYISPACLLVSAIKKVIFLPLAHYTVNLFVITKSFITPF